MIILLNVDMISTLKHLTFPRVSTALESASYCYPHIFTIVIAALRSNSASAYVLSFCMSKKETKPNKQTTTYLDYILQV